MAGCVRYFYSFCQLCLSELNLCLEVKSQSVDYSTTAVECGVERDGYNEHVDNTHTHAPMSAYEVSSNANGC